MNLHGMMSHVGAALAVLAVTFVFFARGWIGGGDAKLAAATALWLGFDHLMAYLLYASIFGGVLTLAMIRFRLMPLPAALGRAGMGEAPAPKLDGGVPYGIALAAAALLIYPDTPWMQARLSVRHQPPARSAAPISLDARTPLRGRGFFHSIHF